MAILGKFRQQCFHMSVIFMNSFKLTIALIFRLTVLIVTQTIQAELLCLPDEFAPFVLEFLLDFLEWTAQTNLPQPLLFPVIRLCGFLLIETPVIYEIIQLYIPSFLRRQSSFTRALVEELTRSG